jgi:voltage-gated potassium channel
VISPKLVLGRAFGNRAVDPCLGNVGEATKFFEGYSIAEFPLYPGNGLVGKTLASSGIQETGAVIIGMRRGGVLSFEVNPSEVITDNCVLLAVGTLEQLSGLKKLTHGGAICRMAT